MIDSRFFFQRNFEILSHQAFACTLISCCSIVNDPRGFLRYSVPRFAQPEHYITSFPICQGFFQKFFKNFFNHFSAGAEVPEYYITSSRVCQEVFQLFFSARLPSGKQPTWEATPRPSTGELVPLTDKGIIAHPVADCNRQNAQIAGFLFFVFCATFPLDKLLGPWYNGNSARAHSRPGRQMSIGNFAQKK